MTRRQKQLVVGKLYEVRHKWLLCFGHSWKNANLVLYCGIMNKKLCQGGENYGVIVDGSYAEVDEDVLRLLEPICDEGR